MFLFHLKKKMCVFPWEILIDCVGVFVLTEIPQQRTLFNQENLLPTRLFHLSTLEWHQITWWAHRARVDFQRDSRDCNILCFTETWLSRDMQSETVQPPGFFVCCADQNKHLSGKKKGGGVCFMINYSWCNCNNIQELKSCCSPDLDFLTIKCRPYYLPRELSSVIVTASSRYHDSPQRTSLDFMQTGNHISWGHIYCSWGL